MFGAMDAEIPTLPLWASDLDKTHLQVKYPTVPLVISPEMKVQAIQNLFPG